MTRRQAICEPILAVCSLKTGTRGHREGAGQCPMEPAGPCLLQAQREQTTAQSQGSEFSLVFWLQGSTVREQMYTYFSDLDSKWNMNIYSCLKAFESMQKWPHRSKGMELVCVRKIYTYKQNFRRSRLPLYPQENTAVPGLLWGPHARQELSSPACRKVSQLHPQPPSFTCNKFNNCIHS